MMAPSLLVCVVDDSESLREALPRLLIQVGLDSKAFESAEAFLESGLIRQSACIIVDICMRGMSGYQLLRQLRSDGFQTPVIFITGRDDETMAAFNEGAVACIIKPFDDTLLLSALSKASVLPSSFSQ
jgi:FixJ family two-component response regulator